MKKKVEDYTLTIQLKQDLSEEMGRKTNELFEMLSTMIPANIWLMLENLFPALSTTLPLTPHLGPRQGRVAPPAFQPGTVSAAMHITPLTGVRISTAALPMAVRREEDEPMGYCVYMTRAGYELQAKLFADGGDFEVTRVEVGSGVLPEGADPSRLTGLAAPRALATSTKPVRKGLEVSLSIEFRSDLCQGMDEAFQITEYGVFAVGADGEEALVLYGDLSDYPDTAVPEQYGGCVRRYPVVVTVGPEAGARLDYPAGAWVIHEELADAIAAHDGDEHAHPYIRGLCSGLDARLSLLELMYNTQVSGNPFTVTFESLTGLVAAGVWNAALNRLEF